MSAFVPPAYGGNVTELSTCSLLTRFPEVLYKTSVMCFGEEATGMEYKSMLTPLFIAASFRGASLFKLCAIPLQRYGGTRGYDRKVATAWSDLSAQSPAI